MWQSRRIKLADLTKDNCIDNIKHALYIAEGAWANYKQDELVSFAQQMKTDAQSQKRLGKIALYNLGKSLSEYAYMLDRQLTRDNITPLASAVNYTNQELRILKDIRQAAFDFIREEIAESEGIALQEAEVFMALSENYTLSFSDEF